MISARILLVSALLAVACRSERTELEPGLAYVSIRDMNTQSGEVAAALAVSGAVIVDLRGARGDLAAAGDIEEALLRPAISKDGMRLVLVNAETSAALTARLPFPGRGLVVLAPAVDQLRADVGVVVALSEDRQAVEALRKGTSPLQLVQAAPEKQRTDEASRDRQPHTSAAAAPSKAAVPADLVLSRALHIYRAWLATRAHLSWNSS